MILHTNKIGPGEALVFLHSGLQTGETDFIYQKEYFNEKFNVITPDLRGHGLSPSVDIQNYFEDSASDLLETLNHLELDKIHLVGSSLGSLVAIKFAQMYPERIITLTVSGITTIKPENWMEIHNEDVSYQANLLINEEAISYFDQLHGQNWQQFIHMGKNANWYPFEDMNMLSSCSFPTLIMVGEAQRNETNVALEYPMNNSNVHIAIVPLAGHLVHSDQPKIYSLILEEFIQQNDGSIANLK